MNGIERRAECMSGRANRVSMTDLRGLVEGLGYRGVRTLLNSGYVVFESSGLQGNAQQHPLLRIATNPSRLLVAVLGEPAARVVELLASSSV